MHTQIHKHTHTHSLVVGSVRRTSRAAGALQIMPALTEEGTELAEEQEELLLESQEQTLGDSINKQAVEKKQQENMVRVPSDDWHDAEAYLGLEEEQMMLALINHENEDLLQWAQEQEERGKRWMEKQTRLVLSDSEMVVNEEESVEQKQEREDTQHEEEEEEEIMSFPPARGASPPVPPAVEEAEIGMDDNTFVLPAYVPNGVDSSSIAQDSSTSVQSTVAETVEQIMLRIRGEAEVEARQELDALIEQTKVRQRATELAQAKAEALSVPWQKEPEHESHARSSQPEASERWYNCEDGHPMPVDVVRMPLDDWHDAEAHLGFEEEQMMLALVNHETEIAKEASRMHDVGSDDAHDTNDPALFNGTSLPGKNIPGLGRSV